MNNDSINTLHKTTFSLQFFAGQCGRTFVIGLAVGYFREKSYESDTVSRGRGGGFLFVSEYYGLTQVSDTHLQSAANAATDMASQSGGFLVDRLSHITSKGTSAAAGFFVGLKVG
ncbi:MAG: hypothetical protein R3E89_09180 [Thiolinea sp.]